MSAPQKRQRPELAGTGREVEQQIAGLRELYSGTTPPTTAPAPRSVNYIAAELGEAAIRLRAQAGGVMLSGVTAGALTDIDTTLAGCGALLRELRQQVRT